MRRALSLALGFGLLASGAVLACSPGPENRMPSPTAPSAPAPPPAPLALDADAEFGGVLHLESARLTSSSISAGDRAHVELAWRLVRPTRRDFRVTVRLLDADRRTRARHDQVIGGNDGGTSGWAAGERRLDPVVLQLSAGIEPARYALSVAVSDPATGIEIPVTAEDGLPPVVLEENHIIGAVRIRAPGS